VNEAILVHRGTAKAVSVACFRCFSLIVSSEGVAAEFIELFRLMFRRIEPVKQFCRATKPFSVFGADVRKQPTAIRYLTRRRALPAMDTGDSQMRTTSFILALAFIMAGPSIAGSSDQDLPVAGTFAYNGSPVAAPASLPMVVAAR
jgi:hypothetical protein